MLIVDWIVDVDCRVLIVWPVTVLDSYPAIPTLRNKSRHSLHPLTGERAALSS